MARRLDRSRPFGEVYGGSEARYEQFDILFDNDGIELPGYEKVQIPDAPTVTDSADTSALLIEIERLHIRIEGQLEENRNLKGMIEDMDAELEEVQGKLDTATIENQRLLKQVMDLSADKAADSATSADAPAPAAEKGKKNQPAQTELDAQLKAQGV